MFYFGGCLQRVQVLPNRIGILRGSLHLGTPGRSRNAVRRRRRLLLLGGHHESSSSLTMLEMDWLQMKYL